MASKMAKITLTDMAAKGDLREPEPPKERPTRADLKARYSANEKGPAA